MAFFAPSPALAAAGSSGAAGLVLGAAAVIVALLAVVFSIILPFTRTGLLRRICVCAFALVAFAFLFIGFAAVFKDMTGKAGHFLLAGFACSAALTFGLVRWLNARARAQLEKPDAPLATVSAAPSEEKPATVGNAPYRKIMSRIYLCETLMTCCYLIGYASLGYVLFMIFTSKPYAPGVRESMILYALQFAGFFGAAWLLLRQQLKKQQRLAPAVFWGATREEAETMLQSEVEGDTRDLHVAQLALDYARHHATEIAAMEQRFIARMTQKHLVSAEAAADMLKARIGSTDISLAAAWHSEGKTAENKADELAYVLNRTAAYDARIFPAAAGYSKVGRVFFWCLATFLLAMYILRRYVITGHVSSPDWRVAGGWLALATGVALTAWLVWMQRRGKMPGRTDGRKAGWGTGLLLAGIFIFILWLFVMPAIGAGATALFGDETPMGRKSWFGETRGR